MKKRFLQILRVFLGLALCVTAAFLIASQPSLHVLRGALPFAFAVLLIVLALRYGILIALIGGPIAALIFAYFVYPPLGSFKVESAASRTNLGWMIFGALAIAYLLSPSPSDAGGDTKHVSS